MNVMEFMEEGILTTIIGMGVVFIVLIVLSFFIKFLNSAVNAAENKKVVQTGSISKNQVESAVSVAANEDGSVQNQEEISPALVAAITASICVLTGKSAEDFRFKQIRRVSGSQSMWEMAGTADLMSTRQRFIERGNR